MTSRLCLAKRGIVVSYDTIRAWVGKFEPQIAKRVRAARSRPTDKWHLDEVVIMINGVGHWLWRAVDSNGEVLDIFLQSRRNARAAKRFISRLITHWGEPRVIVTDKLRSYGAALRKLGLNVDYRAHKGLNNRIEGSHRPTGKREKIQGRFKSARQTQGSSPSTMKPPTCSALAAAFERWNDCTDGMAA